MDALTSEAASLALYANTPLPLALQSAPSDAADFFTSDAYRGRRKEQEARSAGFAALHDRIDNVVKAIASLGSALAGRR